MIRWIIAEESPLQVNADGVFLVGTMRVTLNAVIVVLKQGAITEVIADRALPT